MSATNLDYELSALRVSIEAAFKQSDSEKAVSDLCRIGVALEDLRTLCHARLRLKLPVERDPDVDATTRIDSSGLDVGVAPGAIKAAQKLVSEVRRRLPKGVQNQVEFEQTYSGAVHVTWEPCDLTWVVKPNEIPWPGVHVRLYLPDEQPRTVLLQSEVVEATIAAMVKVGS